MVVGSGGICLRAILQDEIVNARCSVIRRMVLIGVARDVSKVHGRLG